MNFKLQDNETIIEVSALNFNSRQGSESFIKSLTKITAAPVLNLLPSGQYFLYIRDLRDYSIDGKFPAGHTYNKHEIMIALPGWDCEREDIKSVLAHELHHLARWQKAGYGMKLGDVVFSEGLATLYEEEVSGKKPVWAKSKINKRIADKFLKEWDTEYYDHSEWFFDGKMGRWIGYSIGYLIAKKIYKSGIDLKDSLSRKVKLSEIDIGDLAAVRCQ